MNFNLENWLKEFTAKIKKEYGERVFFIGLQGSYKRNEANASSDIDTVVILDELKLNDLDAYHAIILKMPYKEKACGFISGINEIKSWEKSDLFQFCFDTKPILGSLEALFPLINKTDVSRAIKIGACSIYHGCCHDYVFDDSAEILSSLYKLAFFVLQAKYYYETGEYITSKAELSMCLCGKDREIIGICIERAKFINMDREELKPVYNKLFNWSGDLIKNTVL